MARGFLFEDGVFFWNLSAEVGIGSIWLLLLGDECFDP
jgi:hypothetical protein